MPFTLSFDVATPAGLADLDTFIKGRSYVIGFTATKVDVELFTALGKAPDAAKYPNVARFYNHIASFSAEQRAKFPAAFGAAAAGPKVASAGKPAAKAAAAAPAKEEEDDAADLFGDSDDDAVAKKVAAKAAAVKKEEPAPKKKEVIDKTSVIYEVKPMEAGQDMKELEGKIRGISMDGLVWGGEFKVVDVAFGIQKLIIQAVVEDDKVALQDIEDKIMEFNDLVSSLDMTTMNKVAGR